jgi:dihydropteroate synthase
MLDPAVSGQQEQSRLLPVIEGILQARPDAVISVDTYKSATACAAVAAGAEIVNDVSGLGWDPLMATAGAELGCGMVLMHTRGTPEEWRAQPPLDPDRLLPMVMTGLGTSLRMATDAGILRERIVLDPGYGFGKRFDENYVLLARQAELLVLGHPLLAGLSRKSFLTRTLSSAGGTGSRIGHEAIERASLAALVTAILQGASILRVHAVREAVEAAAIADAVLRNL